MDEGDPLGHGRGISGRPVAGQQAQRAHRAVRIGRQRLEQRERAPDLVDAHRPLEAQPRDPADGGALEGGMRLARHEHAYLERVVELDARQLRGRGDDEMQPALVQGTAEPRVRAAVARHTNTCSHTIRMEVAAYSSVAPPIAVTAWAV